MKLGQENSCKLRMRQQRLESFKKSLTGCESCMVTGALDRALHDPQIKQENA